MFSQWRFVLLALIFTFGGASSVPAQTTYWIPKKTTEGQLDCSVQVPDYFVPWLLKETQLGGGKEQFGVDAKGRKYTFVRQSFTYSKNFSPSLKGFFSLTTNEFQGSEFIEEKRLINSEFARALEDLSEPQGPGPTFRKVVLVAIKHTGNIKPDIVLATESYWIARAVKQPGGLTRSIEFSVPVPSYVVPWLLKKDDFGGGAEVTRMIDAKNVSFLRQACSWDNGSVCPITKMFLVNAPAKNGALRVGLQWQFDDRLKTEADFISALDSLALPSSTSQRFVDLLVYKHTGSGKPSVKYSEEIPLNERKGAEMLALGADTQVGQYFANTHAPRELSLFREATLAIANDARRNPNYRKNAGAQTATDFSGDTILTRTGPVKLFKVPSRTQAPYFNDLVLNDSLNRSAQFLAEYQAEVGKSSHEGPRSFQGKDLSTFSTRLTNFGYGGIASEGVASGPLLAAPTVWLRADTDHYKPFFNVGADYKEIGFGVARGKDQNWYFCYVAGTGK